MVYDDRTGQGKLPQELATDNALLKRKYESEELGGAEPVMAIPSGTGVEILGPSGHAIIVIGAETPNDADNRPDGVIYIQTGA